MTAPAEFTRKVTFQRPTNDAHGDPLGDWADLVTRFARIMPLKGGEGVQGQRLEGRQPVVIYVRGDSLTRSLDNGDQAVDARDAGVVWDITSAIWNEKTQEVELLATQHRGRAVG